MFVLVGETAPSIPTERVLPHCPISHEISIEHPSMGLAHARPIMNKSQTVFSGLLLRGRRSDDRLQIRCSVHVGLHKELPEVGLVENLTGSLFGG